MERYLVRLIEKKEVAQDTYAFKLEKPQNFIFKAGQYMEVFVNDLSHTFSIASSPHESHVMFATRIRSGSNYKTELMTIKEGEEIYVEAAAGSMMLPKDPDTPIAFLAGGIGITAVRSMLRYEEYVRSERNIALVYSNRRPEEAAFLSELEAISLKNYRLVPTMTNMQNSSSEWNGEVGYLNRKLLERYIDNFTNTNFYIIGSPSFVSAINDLLSSIPTIQSTHIRAEDYAGY